MIKITRKSVNIQYLYHSGFRVETENYILIFDYMAGDMRLNAKEKEKTTFVFVSHAHPDHFNPEIFSWQANQPEIKYILSDDILSTNSQDIPESSSNITNKHFLSPYQQLEIAGIKIKTYGSTDLGVSFLVEADGLRIFHAGDLNWWYWWGETPEEITLAERLFKEEMSKLKGEAMDIAFFPVDQRLEHNYCVGADFFLKQISPKHLIPMHFGDHLETARQYADKIAATPCKTKIITFSKKGEMKTLYIR